MPELECTAGRRTGIMVTPTSSVSFWQKSTSVSLLPGGSSGRMSAIMKYVPCPGSTLNPISGSLLSRYRLFSCSRGPKSLRPCCGRSSN